MKKYLNIFFTIIGVTMLLIFFGWLSNIQSKTQTINKNPFVTQLNAEKLMSIVNDWRQSQGLQPFSNNDNLCTLADQRVNEIQNDNSHNGFIERVNNQTFGFSYEKLGENLEQGYPNEQEALNHWLSSPEHLKNLKDNFQYSCIKCLNDKCVQEFGNFYPTTTPTPVQTTNERNMFLANNCATQAYKSYMNAVTQLIQQGSYTSNVAQQTYPMYVNGRNGCYTQLGIDPNQSTLPLEPMYPPTN